MRNYLIRLICAGCIFCSTIFAFEAEYRDNAFLFCLDADIKPLTIQSTDSDFAINITELDRYLHQIDANNIEQWIPFATPDDHDGEIYLNRIYRVTLSDNIRQDIPSIVASVSEIPAVHSAELEYIRRPFFNPNDSYYWQQWSLSQINANNAWDYWDVAGGEIPGDSNILLASVDTGVDWDHIDLVNNLWQNLNEDADGDGHTIEYIGNQWVLDPGDLDGIDDDDWDNNPETFIDDLIGWDLSGWSGEDDNNPVPKSGVSNYGTWAHGTHIAGLLSATTDNSTGIASTAYNCRIISVKASQEIQTGQPHINDGYPAILYAAKAGYYAEGFSIINNSWGGYGYNQYEQATINVAHDQYFAVIVAAAGNGVQDGWGEEESTHYPSSYENVISVCPTGTGDAWHHWATYHETVDIAAPGENVYSCVINNNYSAWSGSSMASPIVSSSFGLLKSFYPEWTIQQLETMILATSDPIIYDVNSEGYLQGKLGQGRVDIFKALEVGLFPQIEYAGYDVQIHDDVDGEINPGDSIDMTLILYNNDNWGPAWGVSGHISTEIDGVNIINNNTEFWDMEPGDASLNELDPFVLEFENSVPEGGVEFTITITSNEYDWVVYSSEFSFNLNVIGSSILYGDLNEDEALDVLDVVTMVGIILGSIEPTEYQIMAGDLNGDDSIDVLDVVMLVSIILG